MLNFVWLIVFEIIFDLTAVAFFYSLYLTGCRFFGKTSDQQPSMVQQIVDLLLLILKVLISCVVESVKAFLPNGVLPRKKVQGDIVLITGSGSGLGRLLALEFGRLGAELVLWDVNETGNKETRKMLEQEGVKSNYTPASNNN
ncbi:unnamed protein product, partial [Mesorhabditis belari]|uniref:Epidermal retinol dehydrogenase 2 n=1 Tax=Mesorhabditis belari TaxID=2138241 RepID=A0AAF3FAM0_9BILA